jgi:hypothetical protein
VYVPQVGQANSTEEPKLTNSMVNLSAWANGNVDDADLRSPNNSVRRLLLQATGVIDNEITVGDRILTADSYPTASGQAVYKPPPLWVGDAGVTGQPPDFQVNNKTAYARARGILIAGSAPPSLTVTLGLYQITAVAGVDPGIAFTFGAAFAGSGAAAVNPGQGITAVESAAFNLPSSLNAYALGFSLSNQLPSTCTIMVSAQLYAYNA